MPARADGTPAARPVTSLEARQARYERLVALTAPGPDGEPGMSHEAAGRLFDPPLSRERVRQILAAPPKPNGRPPRPTPV